MEINIADIIKPKFAIGTVVYVRQSGSKDHVRRMQIDSWQAKIGSGAGGKVHGPEFLYTMMNGDSYREGSIFLNPEDAFCAE